MAIGPGNDEESRRFELFKMEFIRFRTYAKRRLKPQQRNEASLRRLESSRRLMISEATKVVFVSLLRL